MNKEEFANKGNSILADIKSQNNKDYLTTKVNSETEQIINAIKGIPNEIKKVQDAVNREKERLRQLELQKKQEEENNNNN